MLCPRCWGSKHDPGSPNGCILCNATGVTPDQRLSPHFMLSEFVQSDTAMRMGLANDPSPTVVLALTDWCATIGEPIREKAGVALHVNSGYRSQAANAVVGGASTSAHRYIDLAAAVDLSPAKGTGLTIKGLLAIVVSLGIPVDQVIYEFGKWVHVGLRGPHGIQRNSVEMVFSPGKYEKYDANDPRVLA